jgi:uncharacterized protein YuzE
MNVITTESDVEEEFVVIIDDNRELAGVTLGYIL